MPIPAADLIQTGLGVVEGAIGLINEGKTKREAQRIAASRPKYNISPLVDQDLALTRSDLGSGLSAGEKAYSDLSNQQFSNSIDATLKSGGGPNSIGAIYGSSEDGRLRLAMMKDNLRLQQIQNAIQQSQRKQQEQQTQWQVNEFAPWQDRAQANAAARQAAAQQVTAGLNTAGAGAMNAANSIQEQNQLRLPSINNPGDFNSRGYATGVPQGNIAPPIANSNILTPNNNTYGYG